MLSFDAIAVLTKTRYAAELGPVSLAIARFIMGERKAVRTRSTKPARTDRLNFSTRVSDALLSSSVCAPTS
jgi:hypothetical protein